GLQSVADVGVWTDRAVRLRRVAARARALVAGAGDVARVLRDARNRIRTRARPALARIRLGAGVPVVAGGPVRLRRVRAHPGPRIADADGVTLVLRHAADRVAARA